MRESKVEAYLVKRVVETGGIVRKVQWIGHRGAPDRWCGWPSVRRSGWVELKRPLTPTADEHQAREHQRMRNCGARVDVISTMEEVDAYVEMMTS